MNATPKETSDRWTHLSRTELVGLGRTIVTERLEGLGCSVEPPRNLIDSKLHVRTPSDRSIEVFVSSQRLGGYVFWTKRRFQPASSRFAAIVLLADADDPHVYLLPSTEWLDASPPFTNRDNVGKKSEPEFGVSLARSSLPALERYGWDDRTARDYLR